VEGVDDNYTYYIPKLKRKTLIGNKREVNLSPLGPWKF
jgi:hypothetical protein